MTWVCDQCGITATAATDNTNNQPMPDGWEAVSMNDNVSWHNMYLCPVDSAPWMAALEGFLEATS
jgi:hypothetical protein